VEVPAMSTCSSIGPVCDGTPAEIKACIEADFTLCPDGGTFEGGTITCDYNKVDLCEEGGSGHGYCQYCP
jgi:hypothetical protein